MTDRDTIGRSRARRLVSNLNVAAQESDAAWIVTVRADAVEDFRGTVDDVLLLRSDTVSDDLDSW